ncbi:MAG: glycine cleavage system protein GcvH [Defluviitaleaceae bacterium]|nr:glycine cleavage system protein GcvH [Defluviitaleaceae bacterium]
MENPTNLKYSKDHEWLKEEGDKVTVGITYFAQDQLGSLVFVNLPEVGDEITKGEPFCDVESVKAVSDVYSPVSGIVSAINEDLLDNPEKINDDPYDAWFIQVEQITETEELLTAEQYEDFCKEEA